MFKDRSDGMYSGVVRHACPKNPLSPWNLGILSGIFHAIQVISGIFLSTVYTGPVQDAFDSVEYVVRDINLGWLIRSTHTNGASFFFACIYAHIIRGMYHRTYHFPRTEIWLVGTTIYVVLMGTAFVGYVLPWGQMSYWAATVITNLVTVVPDVGDTILIWLWGGYSITNVTLGRIYTLHSILPEVSATSITAHLYMIHAVGSSTELGLSTKYPGRVNTMAWFYGYYVLKDPVVRVAVSVVYAYLVSHAPDFLNHTDNYDRANPLVTPAHIVPEWYFLPYYGMLRSVPEKKYGIIITLVISIAIILLPIYDSPNGDVLFDQYNVELIIWIGICNFVFPGIIGAMSPCYPVIESGLICTYAQIIVYYIAIPIVSSTKVIDVRIARSRF